MNLNEMIQEFLSVPDYEITVSGYDTTKLNNARTAFLKSLRNTINKEIENSLNAQELKELIDTYEQELENPLVIALYRRYLWLHPTDSHMYHNFSIHIDTQKQDFLQYINNNDFDRALAVVERIFNDLFVNSDLTQPIKMRTIADIAKELFELDMKTNLTEMDKTSALSDRYYFLLEELRERITNPHTSIVELREYFSINDYYYIVLDCDLGLNIAKRYFNANPTDREMYGFFFHFLRFWNLAEDETVLLQFIAVNDFDKALKFINELKI